MPEKDPRVAANIPALYEVIKFPGPEPQSVTPSRKRLMSYGGGWTDKSYILAPYIPVYKSPTVIDDQFRPRMNLDQYTIDAITKYGKSLVKNNLYVSNDKQEDHKLLMVWVDLQVIRIELPGKREKLTTQKVNRKKTWRLQASAIHTHDMCSPDKRPAIMVVSTKRTPAAIFLPFTDKLLPAIRDHLGMDHGVHEDLRQAIKDNIESAICAEDAMGFALISNTFTISSKAKTAINREKKYKKHLCKST